MNESREKQLREEILKKVAEYAKEFHVNKQKEKDDNFKEGDRVPYASRVYDEKEMVNLVDSALEFWLTAGRYTEEFEKKFAEYLGIRFVSLVNSGSSANLIAFAALTSPLLKERALRPGDEVITVAAGFPTTVNPIIQYGCVPVFLDVDIPGYSIKTELLEEAYSEKTKAVMMAHTLGNPFNIKAVKDFCDRHNLWLVEDNCDALGSLYDGQFTGTFGDVGTSSFYPPHHLTTGEGGAVYTNNPLLRRILLSYRDWGRDCWCDSGVDNTCGCRFTGQFGELPRGYDHKYVYRHCGYNLKGTDLQASIGCAQLKKFPAFVEKRKENWNRLRQRLDGLQDVFILPEPEPLSDPSWFGFLLTVKPNAPFTRNEMVQYLESKKIQTRMLFAGNLIKHPCFDAMRASGNGFRVVGDLSTTDYIMNNTFWIGVYPGMTIPMLDYMADAIIERANENN